MMQSIEGPLKNWSDKEWDDATNWTIRKDGTQFNDGVELKAAYQALADSGCRVMPCGDCDNFDPVKGCLGHKE